MYIEKLIKLRDINYYIRIDVEYQRNEKNNDIPNLKLGNYKNDHYDGGDFSTLLNEIEKNYTFEKAKVYDENISYMADVMYLYDRIPFLSGIRDEYISSKDNIPYSLSYITKEEIEKYIKENNIVMHNNSNFKLSDSRTWFI